jgi:hypothetical protein
MPLFRSQPSTVRTCCTLLLLPPLFPFHRLFGLQETAQQRQYHGAATAAERAAVSPRLLRKRTKSKSRNRSCNSRAVWATCTQPVRHQRQVPRQQQYRVQHRVPANSVCTWFSNAKGTLADRPDLEVCHSTTSAAGRRVWPTAAGRLTDKVTLRSLCRHAARKADMAVRPHFATARMATAPEQQQQQSSGAAC